MGFESMRPGHGKCPTFLVAGLLLMCFLLVCNWWSLSSQNYELLKQMDNMGNQLNLCSDERVICMSRRNSLENQQRELQSRMSSIDSTNKEELAKLKKQKSDLEKSTYNAKQDLTYCQAELESLKKVDSSKQTTLESLRVEKESLASQLLKAKEEINELRESLQQADKAKQVASIPKNTSSTIAQKKPKEDAIFPILYPTINDGPVHEGNHESNKDVETVIENAANEDLDDAPEIGRKSLLGH